MITSYEEVQKYFGRQADKNRKIYNGMLKTYFYQFMGLRPPKKKPPANPPLLPLNQHRLLLPLNRKPAQPSTNIATGDVLTSGSDVPGSVRLEAE